MEADTEAETMKEHLSGLLPMTYSACFLIQHKTLFSEVAPQTMGWAFLYQSLIKEMLHTLAYKQSNGENYSIVFFQDDSSLCQVDFFNKAK